MLLITFSWQVILTLIIICYLIWFIGKQLTNSTNKRKNNIKTQQPDMNLQIAVFFIYISYALNVAPFCSNAVKICSCTAETLSSVSVSLTSK